jgi:hypothetical protein
VDESVARLGTDRFERKLSFLTGDGSPERFEIPGKRAALSRNSKQANVPGEIVAQC